MARKGIEGLLEYTRINPSAVVSQMQAYISGQQAKGEREEKEMLDSIANFSSLINAFEGNLSDFRTAQQGGYEGGFFKFMFESPENITQHTDAGKEHIAGLDKGSEEYQIATSLFPKATQRRLNKRKDQ